MDKVRFLSIAAALSLACTAFAQTQTTPDQSDTQSQPPSSSTQDTSGQSTSSQGSAGTSDPSTSTQSGSQQTRDEQGSVNRSGSDASDTGASDVDSASSRHQREVTGESAKEAPATATGDPASASSEHQQQATKESESESTRMAAAGSSSQIMGATVETPQGEPIGQVVDVMSSGQGQEPSYVVISADGKNTVVPYSAISMMMKNNRIVMDQSRLQSAPTVEQGEWRDDPNGSWKMQADQYWGQGRMRSASPETGTESGSGSSSQQSSSMGNERG